MVVGHVSCIMRHRIKRGRKLSRNLGQRKALMRNLLSSLLASGHLETTAAKAKEVKREFDLLVNRAKRAQAKSNLTIKRQIFSLLSKKELGQKLFDEVLPKFSTRRSGYLTLIKTGKLRNDGAENILLSFVKEEKK